MEFFEQIASLRREGQSFAVATVVARRAPVSAHLGDRAIVFADGRMEGFIGGACSRDIIRRQALEAIAARYGRLVSIRPEVGNAAGDTAGNTAEHVVVPMTCVSEGAIDVYVEPFVPARRLLVVGATPVAESLTRLARSMNYDVVRVVEERELRDLEPEAAALGVTVAALGTIDTIIAGSVDLSAVVASQGHYDEEALEAILKGGVPYVGLVASRTRGAAVKAQLAEHGLPGVTTIRSPAGLDLGARTAPEVALSILAEIVQAHPAGAARATTTAAAGAAPSPAARPAAPATAVDPVCGMSVTVASARHQAERDGVTYYFCCRNCLSKFLAQ